MFDASCMYVNSIVPCGVELFLSEAKVVVSRHPADTLSALRGELTTLGTHEELGTSLSPSFGSALCLRVWAEYLKTSKRF